MRNFPGSSTSFPANVRIPEGGDRRNSTNFAAGFEDLSNRTKFLESRVPGAAGSYPSHVLLQNGFSTASGTVWTYGVGGADANYWTHTQLSSNRLVFDITQKLPPKCTITGYRAVILPYDTHGNLPATMPKIELLRRSIFAVPSTVWNIVSTATDGSINLSTYEQPHYLGPNNVSIAVDHSDQYDPYRWAIAITGESGTNAITGTLVLAVFVLVGP